MASRIMSTPDERVRRALAKTDTILSRIQATLGEATTRRLNGWSMVVLDRATGSVVLELGFSASDLGLEGPHWYADFVREPARVPDLDRPAYWRRARFLRAILSFEEVQASRCSLVPHVGGFFIVCLDISGGSRRPLP